MLSLAGRIDLALRTYAEAYRALGRQYDPRRIAAVQDAKLRKLVEHCYTNIKYYRESFDNASIKPEHIRSVGDLSMVPLLTKEQLRDRFWDFLPRELPPCRVSRTSGSTGIPVCLLSDVHSRHGNSAAVIRYRAAVGLSPFAGSILTPLKTAQDPRRLPHWSFLQGAHRTYYVNPYIEQNSEIEYAAHIIRRLKRPAIIGITPAVNALAFRIRDGILPPLHSRAVLTFGETLSPQVRQVLEDTFGVGVTDIYACNEAGDIAWQCHMSKLYHVNADNCVLEILNQGRRCEEGEVGEVVITNLNRLSMPILRYKNGDLARGSYQACPCGCRLPVLLEVIGRTGEDMILPNSRVVPWHQLKSCMNHQQIRQFQLWQNEDASLDVRLVLEKDTNVSGLETTIRSRLCELLGGAVPVVFSYLDRIPPSASGKSKLVVSKYKGVPQTAIAETD